MGITTKRSSMTFYSDSMSHYSHRVRLVLSEKGVNVDIIEVDIDNKPEDLIDLNPYNQLPTLVDRELTLYESKVIMEYLDERFPHPPLLPVYPVARAQSRLWIYRVERDWCRWADIIIRGTVASDIIAQAKRVLKDNIMSVIPIFEEKPFFMSEEFTLVDCCVVPILWRLPVLDIELNEEQAKPMYDYLKRVFERDSFQNSLSEYELEIRENSSFRF